MLIKWEVFRSCLKVISSCPCLSMKMTRAIFIWTVMLVLFASIVGKLLAQFAPSMGTEYMDPIFPFLTARQMMLLAAVFECVVVTVLALRWSTEKKCLLILWMCLTFACYRLGLWIIGFQGICSCFGQFFQYLGLSNHQASRVSQFSLAYMAIGAGICLIASRVRLWRNDTRVRQASLRSAGDYN